MLQALGIGKHNHGGAPYLPFGLNRLSRQSAGLVGWWPIAASPGGKAVREFAHGLDAEAQSGVARDYGPDAGYCLDLNGSSDYYLVAQAPILDIVGDLSVSFWIYWKSLPTSGGSMDVVSKEQATDWLCPYLISALEDSGDVNYLIYHHELGGDWGGSATFTSHNIQAGIWEHCLFTRNTTTKVFRFYLNGRLQEEDSGGWTDNPATAPLVGMHIGRAAYAASRYADAKIGDLRVYNRVLSANEASAIYAPGTRWELCLPTYLWQGCVGAILGERGAWRGVGRGAYRGV